MLKQMGRYQAIIRCCALVQSSLSQHWIAHSMANAKPISDKFIAKALEVSGFSREETQSFGDPFKVMNDFGASLATNCKGRMMFVSDNNGFDCQFINWYFHHYLGSNPFGFSSTNLGSLYKGMQKDMFVNFKHLRKTKHTHDPVDDARGNAEAMLELKELGRKINFS
jgi:hypothetical protein